MITDFGARLSVPKKRPPLLKLGGASAKWQHPIWSSLILGLIGFLVCFAGSWIPSPWLDEAATAHIVSYSIGDMTVLWQRTDIVFAPYYMLMNALVSFTGITPFWLRLPSLLAVGAGTAAMAATGRAVGGPKAQIVYAACFALLPRVTAMGIEARPYALSAMFMTFALLSVVKLHQKNSGWYWLLLGLSMIGAVSAHIFAALAVIGLVLVAFILFSGKSRLCLLMTSAVAGLACLPLAIVSFPQQSQVSWIAESAPNIADQALVEAWFTTRWNTHPSGTDVPLHYLAVVLAVLAAATVAMAIVFARPMPKGRLALATIPPATAISVLWGLSLAQEPMLLGRYLTSSAPFAAMLLAESLMLLRPHAKQVMASLLVIGCVVIIVSQRQPYAKVPSNDYSFIASALHNHARDGDGLLLEPGLGPVDSARSAMALYPDEFDGLVDIARTQVVPLTHVFAGDPPVANIEQQAVPPRVWLVTKVDQDSNYALQLSNLGYGQTSSSSGPGHTVALWIQH